MEDKVETSNILKRKQNLSEPEQHSPTSLKAKKMKQQEEQSILKELPGSTEKMLEDLSSESTSLITEDIEDVFETEIIKIFKKTAEFLIFAQSENGLRLSQSDMKNIVTEEVTNIDENQKMSVLRLWKEKNESTATPVRIREIVKQYYEIGPENFTALCDGEIRVFQNPPPDWENELFFGEMLNIIDYHFCAIRLIFINKIQTLKVAKKLLDEKHENIVSVLDVGTYHGPLEDRIYIVTELTWQTNLRDIFNQCDPFETPFHEPTALNLVKQMLLALDFIHSNDIIYGGLIPENILVSDDRKHLKLSNFERSKVVSYDTHNKGFLWYYGYNAPEVYTLQECKESDIFSAGIVLAEIFSNGIHPYGDDAPTRQYNLMNFQNLDLGNLVNDNRKGVTKVIRKMLNKCMEKRPTAVQVLCDSTFFQFPFKILEDERKHILIQCRKSTDDREEIVQWSSDETGNLIQLGKPRIIKNTAAQDGVELVAIHNREVTESDIPKTNGDEGLKEYIFDFWGCKITTDFLSTFYKKMDPKCKITRLKVAYTEPGNISGLIEMICSIVGKWNIRSLSLEYDHLNDKDISLLRKFLRQSKIRCLKELDISYNKDISSSGFQQIGELKREFHIQSLLVTACDLTDEKLEKFLEGVDDSPFKELNLSCNRNLTAKAYTTLAKFAADEGVKSLKLSACELTKEIIDEFQKQPSEIPVSEPLLDELDVSYNPGITPNTSLGSIIIKYGTKKLNLAGCEFGEEHSLHMRKHMRTPQHELDTMCMRDNNTISGGLSEIAKLVKHCSLRELDIVDCMLSAADLRAFREKLNGAKLETLHLGDEERVPDASYMKEIDKLLPNVTDVMYLQFHELSSDFSQLLYNHIGKCPAVMINLSDGSTEKWTRYEGYRALTLIDRHNRGLDRK